MKKSLLSLATMVLFCFSSFSAVFYEKDEFQTTAGKLVVTFYGHSSFLLEINGKAIYLDPIITVAEYSRQPKADLILVTHEHHDHFDSVAIGKLTKNGTQLFCNGGVQKILKRGFVLKNGDVKTWEGIKIEAVPAYNTTPTRDTYHPKARDNGYILTIGDMRFYFAGDTENIPEMKALKAIDVAFLPMNQPFTMTPEQVVEAAASFMPKILYPCHTGDTDVETLRPLMSKIPTVELRIRNLK